MTERFELLEQVGKGGMGTVWKARDRHTGELVALKLLHEQYADDPYFLERFEREVEVTRRVQSPHVVRMVGYGVREGLPYVSMEYVEGRTLRDILRERGRLDWPEAKGRPAPGRPGPRSSSCRGRRAPGCEALEHPCDA